MNSREIIATLRQVVFLKTAADDALAELAAAGHTLSFRKGELLFAARSRCRGLFVVLRGAVKVYNIDSRGRELTFSVQMPGTSAGELPLFDGGNYPYHAEAAHTGTDIFFVPREAFRAVMQGCPEIGERALLALGIQLRQMVQLAEAQSLHTVQARLAAYLLETASGRSQFALGTTNEAISNQLGTVREVVSRTLRALKESGVISLQGRTVLVLDPEELRRLANADQ